MSWCSQLVEWGNQAPGRLRDASEDVYAVINQTDVLVVSVGDSWTWGDFLDPDLRLTQVYGALISKEINADWINIGCRGWSNSYILAYADYVVDLLSQSNYKKIYFIITLTENGRDIKSANNFHYDYLELFNQFGAKEETYDRLLIDIENFWVKQINSSLNKMDSRYHVLIGQNFVWHQNLADQLDQLVTVLDLNWIECLADAQGLPRPVRTNLVTGWIFNTVNFVHDIVQLSDTTEFKKWALPKIDQANKVNEWLNSSPMNYKKASKHPIAEGHQVWANYILKRLFDN